jgi:predicted DNA-binding protein
MKKRVSFTIDKTFADELDSIVSEMGWQKSRVVEVALIKCFEAIDTVVADKRLSKIESGEEKTISAKDIRCLLKEVWDSEIDAAYDDYPEVTQKELDRAKRRKGLKLLPKSDQNPFDVLAKQAKHESRAGKTVTLEDFERRMKKSVFRESVKKGAKLPKKIA